MNPKIDIITLGVADRERARRFYERALGGQIEDDGQSLAVNLGGKAAQLVLRDWEAVAAAADVDPQSAGFRAFTLSFIVDTADGVDQVLERAAEHGGVVSKPPKNAVWGYSAYVTDPDGYLWKVASSKRRPLLARKGPSADNGKVIAPKEVPITIGVADMRRAKEFYEAGLGLPVKKAYGTKFVMFGNGDGGADLGMYKREALADDAAVQPEGSGFHGFSITHLVESPQRVDALLARASEAGGKVLTRPSGETAVPHSGYFEDPDGNVWQITCSN
jgi:catechol 2,3-dioxygenase-like lactoylglutathione lyase family enzyme